MALTVATYNIHRCIGRNGARDPHQTAAVIRELDADIVALQEVETLEGGDPDFVRALKQHSEYNLIAGPTLFRENASYGNLVLSRWPVAEVERLDLSYTRREPRGAILALVESDAGNVLAAATHLGLRAVERRFQMRTLLRHLETSALWSRAALRVLFGDFNEWFRWSRPLRWVQSRFGQARVVRSFPAHRPLLALDRIWVAPRRCLTSVSVHRTPLARSASDHLPVCAQIAMPGATL